MSDKSGVVMTDDEAKALVDRLGPHIDSRYDYTDAPIFPEGRQDVATVRRMAENGHSYGFDTIWLVWKTAEGLRRRQLIDSRDTKDYLIVHSIQQEGDTLVIEINERHFRIKLAELGLE